MRKSIFIILTTFVIAAAQAQQPSKADPRNDARAKIGEYLAKGDTASAEKIVLELTPKLAAAGPAGGSVFFEEIRACGFYPQETRLECVVDIKQNFGYGGPIGSFGSFEYVSFFVDWQGNGFQTSDYVGSGIVHMTDGSGGTNFAVYRDFNPPGGPRTSNGGNSTTTMTNGPVFKVLAKLSWFTPVTNPAQPQIWGNDFTFAIRMMPIR